ncbi:hypothetical protein LHV13_09140 [Ferrovum sp. PN-J185]|uniref:hypothetical protein n=1 Tax=Ferrovum sp. PN-J185 TaxID=1356306 RepID=UPI00079AF6A5|nr:hypothetical protein [Ferrovum sp. PN-J185]KXW55207.1 hypothetical protein FV185_17200 [Ferrovum sp. PN-J185]MCC6069334.1 hypothetical protein [Ferrovum sp. PN-J185]
MRIVSLISVVVSVLSVNVFAADALPAQPSNAPMQQMPLASPAPQPANAAMDNSEAKPKKHHKQSKAHHASKAVKKHHKKHKHNS